MNVVREINQINQKELERGGAGSWHDDYRDSAYIFVGGLPFEMTEGDVITVFSQYGEIADVNLPKDKDKGTSRGFAFVMYVDQRSTVLAVDNLNGAKVAGRTLRVDHTKGYSQPKVRNEETGEMEDAEEQSMNAMPALVGGPSAARVGAGADAANGDDVDMEDPMAAYILEERRREALEGSLSTSKKDKSSKHRHRSEEKTEKKERKREKELAKEAKRQQRAESSSYTHRRSRSRSPISAPSSRSTYRRDDDRDRDVRRSSSSLTAQARRSSRSPVPSGRVGSRSPLPPSPPPRRRDDLSSHSHSRDYRDRERERDRDRDRDRNRDDDRRGGRSERDRERDRHDYRDDVRPRETQDRRRERKDDRSQGGYRNRGYP